MWTLRPVRTAEGRRYVGFQPMRLIKSENPALALTWTLFHPIDADSPLYGVDAEALRTAEINFIVSVTGFDETSAQTLRARHTFAAQDVRFDHEFVDIIRVDEDGVRHVDYGKLHEIRPIARGADPPS
jgi:inward rectifier potassium channel